jgi:hypothetical protein
MAGDTQLLIEGKNLRHFFFIVLSGKCVGQPIAKMDSLALMVLRYNASINPYNFHEDGYHAVYINSCLLHQLLPKFNKATNLYRLVLYSIMILINNTKYSCMSCIKVKIRYSVGIEVSTPDYIVSSPTSFNVV